MKNTVAVGDIAKYPICPRMVYLKLQGKREIPTSKSRRGQIEHRKIEKIVKEGFKSIRPYSATRTPEKNIFAQKLGIRINPQALEELEMMLSGADMKFFDYRLVSYRLRIIGAPDLIAKRGWDCIVAEFRGASSSYVTESDMVKIGAHVMLVQDVLWPELDKGHLVYHKVSENPIKEIYLSRDLRTNVLGIRDNILLMQQTGKIPEYKKTNHCRRCGYFVPCEKLR